MLPFRPLFPIVCLFAAAFGPIGAGVPTVASAGDDGSTRASAVFALEASPEQTDSTRSCGPPSYRCSYDGTDPKPLCTDCAFPPVPDMSARPNAVWYDKVLGTEGDGNQVVRCTYPETTQRSNSGYSIGFGGSGDTDAMSKGGGIPFSYRLIISNSEGGYPFTYTPDPVHPRCFPTYPIGAFRVADGSFSWLTPHLYYAFGGYYLIVSAIDLDSIRLPERNPVADFQQILPHDGPDWPGPNQNVPLGTIIKPLTNNAGKYLFQATCAPGHTSCPSARTAASPPSFTQATMTDTADGTVVWRNIGVGFNGVAKWYAVGGLSTDDDVFVKAFSDDGGQGGPGAIFIAAYKRSTNVYHLYNVGTGIISSLSCQSGKGYNCSGGRWEQSVLGTPNLPDRFRLHNLKVSKNGKWVLLEQGTCAFQTCTPVPNHGPGMFVWELGMTSANVRKITVLPWGHWTTGFDLLVNQNGNRGENLTGRKLDGLDDPFLLNHFSFALPPSLSTEAHPSWNANDGSDTTPVCTATVGYDWPYTIPWENEVVCYGTNPNPDCSSVGHGACRTTVKRFFRTYNPATCDLFEDFNACMGIGALSADGKYYAFTSNWGDTLGSTSHGGDGPGSCRGGFNFQKNHAYKGDDVFEPAHDTGDGHPNSRFNVFKVTVAGSSSSPPPGAWPAVWWSRQSAASGFYSAGDIILPRTVSDNPCNHAFQVTAGGKPNGTTRPVWKDVYGYKGSCSAITTGSKVQDGGIIWTDIGEYVLGSMHLANLGRDDCRSDVFIGALN
ncbi:MAG TPA: hypothetical protein VKV39_02885 [Candidatus Sulfotelmatobacter sp.]|nr:hypothetical protein [Candidatus Sulfotelmatobacter sp.]